MNATPTTEPGQRDPLGATAPHAARFDVEAVRRHFPALHQRIHDKPLVYLDNAASAHKPRAVLEALEGIYGRDYSNVHRGVHTLSQRATDAYEAAREKARRFLGAEEARQVVFVRGATEGINLVAQSFVAPRLEPGDEIVLSAMEHHSNIVPWQMVCEARGARLRVIPMDERGELDLEAYGDLLGERTRMVALIHVSNALGTINPAQQMVAMARERGIPTLLDGAQAAPHLPLDVVDLGCDFYTISSHKLFGPTGIGLLYGRGDHFDRMPPYQGGGEMILSVSFDKTQYAAAPQRFEAGTPNIAGAVALGAVFDFLDGLDLEAARAHEDDLLAYATARLEELPGTRIVGTARHKVALVSVVLDGIHSHDAGTILDGEGIAVRVGHHCAQPVMEQFGLTGTLRASFAFYNTRREVDLLIQGIQQAREIFGL